MAVPATAVFVGGIACTPDGAVYVEPTNAGYVLAQSWTAVTAPADTAENILATIPVPANTVGAGGTIKVYTRWACTNNANVKTTLVRYSGPAGTTFLTRNIASIAANADQREINFITAGTQTGFGLMTDAFGQTSAVEVTSSVDSTVATSVVISATKATGSDTVTLVGYRVEVIRAP